MEDKRVPKGMTEECFNKLVSDLITDGRALAKRKEDGAWEILDPKEYCFLTMESVDADFIHFFEDGSWRGFVVDDKRWGFGTINQKHLRANPEDVLSKGREQK